MPKTEIIYRGVGVNDKATHGDYAHLCQRWEGLTEPTAKSVGSGNEKSPRFQSVRQQPNTQNRLH